MRRFLSNSESITMASVLNFSILMLFLLGTTFAADTCDVIEGLEGCACIMRNSSKTVSLQDLVGNITSDVPKFKTPSLRMGWNFAFQPCGTFDMFLDLPNPRHGDMACDKSAVGRYTDISSHICEGLGGSREVKFEYREEYEYPVVSPLLIVVKNGSSNHGAKISLVCNETMNVKDTQFKYVNVTEGVTQYYHFSLTSPCACPGGCNVTCPEGGCKVGSTHGGSPSSATNLMAHFGIFLWSFSLVMILRF